MMKEILLKLNFLASIKPELYRVNDAQTNAGQRLVSDSFEVKYLPLNYLQSQSEIKREVVNNEKNISIFYSCSNVFIFIN